jgi:zinc protease
MAGTAHSVERAALGNGMVVVATRTDFSPTFVAMLTVDAGSRYDPDGKCGLAALTASALVHGLGTRTEPSIARRIEASGGLLDVTAGYETATLTVVGLSESLDTVVGLLAELAARPDLCEKAVLDARRRHLTELAEDDSDAYRVCHRALFDMVFPDHPRGRPVAGRAESVATLTYHDVAAHAHDRYRPSGAVLSVVGALDPRRAVDVSARHFARWEGDPVAGPVIPGPRRQSEARRRVIDMPNRQTHIALGHVGVSRTDPDYYAATVIDTVLGDGAGFGSRLASRLREEEGLAYVVESDVTETAGRDPGIFCVHTATSPENASGAIDGMLEELGRLRDAPISPRELESAVAYLRGRHVLDAETSESRAARLTLIERFALGPDFEERYPTLIGSVSVGDVLAAARRIIPAAAYSLVIVGPSRDPECHRS